ncbi:MAG: SusC/RagA family TonB-linked outer membrane protein [Candidatus Pedobacter colombiensis]|uniref:SusC/RagA family TonB-linked outer membrane protein n=1 Tax=Candidatus Pedobacter colombiensis TaxID=3121371 RepID=A0AAJ6B6S6_9SPHI|nr:SusC/RagA family TonB-linked outer membrane protein [Pedobacter sp.]WEK19515.1 MAG: SusC/RagA family TonB-linked outer membrane protein [Pedobacter sp.]
MKRKILMLFLSTFLLVAHTMAQQITVTGKVTSAGDQLGVPGASVKIKGTSSAVQTNVEGGYSIKVAKGDVLVFSYIGFLTQEKTIGNASVINVVLATDSKALNEVVVTALGIERNKRTLTYSVQTVKGDDLRDANQSNIINGLQGQIAGAQITSSGGSPGLPSEIILRGVSSLTGDNQPLMIVDGIRVSNASTDGTVNRLADFNPADIENISVLKGAAAAALYGIDAASGAIIITTKKGKEGKLQSNLSYKSFIETVGRTPEQQKLYTSGTGSGFDESSISSWGRKYRSDELIYDNIDRFFKTGVVHDVNFNSTGGAEKFNYYMSGNYRNGSSIIPNTETDKFSVLIKGSAKLAKNLELNASANYINNNIKEGIVGGSSGGYANGIYMYPLRYDINRYQYPNGNPYYEYYENSGSEETARISPMWSVMKNPRNTGTQRIVVNGELTYNVNDWINLSYRSGQDYYNQDYSNITVPGTPGSYMTGGRLYQTKGNYKYQTNIFNSTFDKKIISDLRATLILGASSEYFEVSTNSFTGEGFIVPDVYSVNNIPANNLITTEGLRKRQRYAVYGDFKLDYKNILSLGVTGRNDWSSTLPITARSFYSPSFSGSFSFSELFENKDSWFGKLRASYAKVGKDAPIYATYTTLLPYYGIGGGYQNNSTGGNTKLVAETTIEKEFGFELRLFKSRLNLEGAYYDKQSRDQIVTARVPLPTGFVIQTFNAGKLRNRGFELSLNGSPIKTKDFTWSATLNTWINRSKMLQFPGQIEVFPYTFGQPYNAAKAASMLNMPVLGLVGTDYLKNADGYTIIGSDGYPVINSENQAIYIGNREPKINFGFLNKLNYKEFSLSFLWDFRLGGDVYNATRLGMTARGISREVGDWRDRSFTFNGVALQEDGSYAKNTKEVPLNYTYFVNNYTAVGTNFIETVNWARVRYITFGYTLPKKYTDRLKLARVSLELSAQNPILITNYSGGDPEVNSAGPNAGGGGGSTMGVDYGAIPLSKTYSIGISVGF